MKNGRKWLIILAVMLVVTTAFYGVYLQRSADEKAKRQSVYGSPAEQTETAYEADYTETEPDSTSSTIQLETYQIEVIETEWKDTFAEDIAYCEPYDYPEKEGDVRYEEGWIDWEAIRSAYSEYNDLLNASEGEYTPEEATQIYEEVGNDIIKQYSYDADVAYDYLYVQGRLINQAANADGVPIANEVYLNSQILVATSTYYDFTYYYAMYFEQSQYPDDTSLFCCELEPEEVLEFTVAFAVPEKEREHFVKFLYGEPDFQTYAEGGIINPAGQTERLVEVRK